MKKKILIIDDFATTRFVLKTSLQNDYEVIEASNGKAGLMILLKNTDVKLIVTDLNMPIMDGIEFTREVRKDPVINHIPIIMVTTEIAPEKKVQAKNAGVTWWAKKPYKLATFFKIVKKGIL